MFASAWGKNFGAKRTSYSDLGHSKTSENGFTGIFPWVFGCGQILRPKKWLYCFRTPLLGRFLDTCYAKYQIEQLFMILCQENEIWYEQFATRYIGFVVIVSLHAKDDETPPQIYLKWKFLCTYLCQNLQYFGNSDTVIKLGHQKGVDCAFFGVFIELLGGAAKFWGS